MRTLKVTLLAAGLAAGLATTASAQVNFDDITSSPFAWAPSSYAGLNWTNAFVIDGTGYFGSIAAAGGFHTARSSGSYVMGNAGAMPLSISSGSLFNLTGGHFAASWTNGLSLNAKGYANGIELYSRDYNLNWDAGQHLNLDMFGVDNVVFTNAGGTVDGLFNSASNNGFSMDDLEFSTGERAVGVSVVPEPMTVSLMGFGLFAVGMVARRRHQATAA